MRIITKMRVHKAAWWKRLTPDDHGVYSYDDPVLIDCRWDDVREEYKDRQGEARYSRSVVYPDRELSIGDCLLFTDELPETSDPVSVNAIEVAAFDSISTLNGKQTLYIAYL